MLSRKKSVFHRRRKSGLIESAKVDCINETEDGTDLHKLGRPGDTPGQTQAELGTEPGAEQDSVPLSSSAGFYATKDIVFSENGARLRPLPESLPPGAMRQHIPFYKTRHYASLGLSKPAIQEQCYLGVRFSGDSLGVWDSAGEQAENTCIRQRHTKETMALLEMRVKPAVASSTAELVAACAQTQHQRSQAAAATADASKIISELGAGQAARRMWYWKHFQAVAQLESFGQEERAETAMRQHERLGLAQEDLLSAMAAEQLAKDKLMREAEVALRTEQSLRIQRAWRRFLWRRRIDAWVVVAEQTRLKVTEERWHALRQRRVVRQVCHVIDAMSSQQSAEQQGYASAGSPRSAKFVADYTNLTSSRRRGKNSRRGVENRWNLTDGTLDRLDSAEDSDAATDNGDSQELSQKGLSEEENDMAQALALMKNNSRMQCGMQCEEDPVKEDPEKWKNDDLLSEKQRELKRKLKEQMEQMQNMGQRSAALKMVDIEEELRQQYDIIKANFRTDRRKASSSPRSLQVDSLEATKDGGCAQSGGSSRPPSGRPDRFRSEPPLGDQSMPQLQVAAKLNVQMLQRFMRRKLDEHGCRTSKVAAHEIEALVRKVYEDACEEFGVRPNSLVLKRIGDAVQSSELVGRDSRLGFDISRAYDFSHSHVGDRGVRCILYALAVDPYCTEVSLRACGLRQAGAELVSCFVELNPYLGSIDLSENDLSFQAGEVILSALQKRPKVLTELSQSFELLGNLKQAEALRAAVDVQINLGSTALAWDHSGGLTTSGPPSGMIWSRQQRGRAPLAPSSYEKLRGQLDGTHQVTYLCRGLSPGRSQTPDFATRRRHAVYCLASADRPSQNLKFLADSSVSETDPLATISTSTATTAASRSSSKNQRPKQALARLLPKLGVGRLPTKQGQAATLCSLLRQASTQ